MRVPVLGISRGHWALPEHREASGLLGAPPPLSRVCLILAKQRRGASHVGAEAGQEEEGAWLLCDSFPK